MSSFTIITATHGVTSRVIDFSTPLFSLVNWAQMLARNSSEVVRYQFEEGENTCEVENGNIRFGVYKDGQFVGYTEWATLGFFNNAFSTYARSIGLNFLDRDGMVQVENFECDDNFIELPEVDFEEVCEQTTYGNGPVEYETTILETDVADTTLHMAYRLEMLPSMEERFMCVLSLDHSL